MGKRIQRCVTDLDNIKNVISLASDDVSRKIQHQNETGILFERIWGLYLLSAVHCSRAAVFILYLYPGVWWGCIGTQLMTHQCDWMEAIDIYPAWSKTLQLSRTVLETNVAFCITSWGMKRCMEIKPNVSDHLPSTQHKYDTWHAASGTNMTRGMQLVARIF